MDDRASAVCIAKFAERSITCQLLALLRRIHESVPCLNSIRFHCQAYRDATFLPNEVLSTVRFCKLYIVFQVNRLHGFFNKFILCLE